MLTDETQKLVKQYRKSENLLEIEEYVGNLNRKHYRLLAWQKLPQDKKVSHIVTLGALDPKDKEIKLFPADPPEKITDFNIQYPLYIHTENNRVVMEVKIAYIGPQLNHVFVHTPDALYLWEQKRVPRIQIQAKKEATLVTFTKQKKTFELPLIDISSKGMAFQITPLPAKYFNYVNDEIIISKIFNHKLEESISGRIVYLKQIDENNKNKGFRVGIEFKSEIDITREMPSLLI